MFNLTFRNRDGSAVQHAIFDELIVYVYTYSDQIIKFSKSSKYNQMAVVSDTVLQVRMTAAQTAALAPGLSRVSVYATIPSNDMPDGKVSLSGKRFFVPIEADPIKSES